MATTKVIFEFPSEAWDGIVLSLTDGQWSETVPNPDYNPEVEGSEPTIPNPVDRWQLAIGRIKNFVEQEFKAWATRERMALVYQQAQSEVKYIAETVTAATTATIETQ
jgi:hypothetical protein